MSDLPALPTLANDPVGADAQEIIRSWVFDCPGDKDYADKAQAVAFTPVGQIVGAMNQVRPARVVVSELIDGYYDAVERLQGLMPSDDE